MVIIGLTDIHGNGADIDALEKVVRKADLVLLAGDLTHFGRETEAVAVLEQVRRFAKNILAVTGNCDYPEVSQVLNREKVNCHGDCVLFGGVNFIGLGGSLMTPFDTPGEYTEEELAAALEAAAAKRDEKAPLVLVSHQPPVNTVCDRLNAGNHVGSQVVRQFIDKHQPFFCLTGHIHEAAGTDRIGRSTVVNPGPISQGGYMYAEIMSREEVVSLRRVSPQTV